MKAPTDHDEFYLMLAFVSFGFWDLGAGAFWGFMGFCITGLYILHYIFAFAAFLIKLGMKYKAVK